MEAQPVNTSNGQQHENGPTLKTLEADVQALKRDLAKAVGALEARAAGSAATVGTMIVDAAGGLTDDLSAHADRAKKSIASQVEKQPLTSLAIAFATGFITSRFLAR
jgi:hypothetical protein